MTPIYLTLILPDEETILPAHTAVQVSVAFPYEQACHQEPLGERVINNDLYGVPLYKPSVRLIDNTEVGLKPPRASRRQQGQTLTLTVTSQ